MMKPAMTASVVFVSMVFAMTAQAATVIDTFDSISSNWTTDRYDPAVFQSVYFDGDNRLETGVSAADFNPHGASFYNWQGKSLLLPADTMGCSVQLYVSSDWLTSQRKASLWLNGWNGVTDQLAWPIMALESDGSGSAFWTCWNDISGTWTNVSLPSGFAFDAWHNMKLVLDNGNAGMYADGELLYTDTAVNPAVTSFKNVILQTRNFGATYSGVYWDNLTVVPEPGSLVLLATACLGLLAYAFKGIRT
jgi:hypothetical protein